MSPFLQKLIPDPNTIYLAWDMKINTQERRSSSQYLFLKGSRCCYIIYNLKNMCLNWSIVRLLSDFKAQNYFLRLDILYSCCFIIQSDIILFKMFFSIGSFAFFLILVFLLYKRFLTKTVPQSKVSTPESEEIEDRNNELHSSTKNAPKKAGKHELKKRTSPSFSHPWMSTILKGHTGSIEG